MGKGFLKRASLECTTCGSGMMFLSGTGNGGYYAMKRKISCPARAPSTCNFLEMVPAGKDDIVPSVDLVKRAFPYMKINEREWVASLERDDAIVVKENGVDIIGIAALSSGFGKSSSLDLLAVDSIYRGAGIGSKLLSEMERVASMKGKDTVSLITEQAKPENVIFYSKHGYKVTGYDPAGYSHSPSVAFRKKIGTS